MTVNATLILIGTLWPVIGIVLALLLAFSLKGWPRWLLFIVGPVLMLTPCLLFAEQIAYNGNMLFVALMGVAVVFLCLYYPILLIYGVICYVRQQRQTPG